MTATTGTALIVVDMQLDFCPGGTLAVAGADEIIAPINAMMPDFDAVILTQDWHPPNHSSFADNHPDAKPYDVTTMPYGPQVLWPRHCVMGSDGARFHPDLLLDCADMIVRKGFREHIDSYSTFFENDHTTPTGLGGYLRDRGLTQLTLVGLAHDFCVAWSAVDAVRLGFSVEVRTEATRAIDLDGTRMRADAVMRAEGVVLK
ncbi:bifunctional nicotinamidase/pyrazinamidase [Paracoccus suum]|uniref:Nicotinamidase n=1 Tax=Paracoccus suum TaxID=2259340 RepID=A0A344PI52_9RHOB|nr:bifunctional nicotinamidase/pyrazinamidase [Paracoccus suum]AXC49057.1 bifunctional nicotinamidase/pyrazinamidase [Paracoccus suum]